MSEANKVVYVVGAGLSAGLGFPVVKDLMPRLWDRVKHSEEASSLKKVIEFHHPQFDEEDRESFPDIEKLLSEMQANEQLFSFSRSAPGGFKLKDLKESRNFLLFELVKWFHELKKNALESRYDWLQLLTQKMKEEQATIISFNWDLVLDQLLFEGVLSAASYGFDRRTNGPWLIKPHGSLNWFKQNDDANARIKEEKKIQLIPNPDQVFAFAEFRGPYSSDPLRKYMPLIVPPVYSKTFKGELFKRLWLGAVTSLSQAAEVRFLGYSLPDADLHARFILRCGFHNQKDGLLMANEERQKATGPAKVTIVNPCQDAISRVATLVNWPTKEKATTIEHWVFDELVC